MYSGKAKWRQIKSTTIFDNTNDNSKNAQLKGTASAKRNQPVKLKVTRSVQGITCEQQYTVVSGDTCDKIGDTFGVTGSAIITANSAINSGCTNLQGGQVLCIPSTSGRDNSIPNWQSCTRGVDTCADNWSCCIAPADCTSGKTTCRPSGNECSSCSSGWDNSISYWQSCTQGIDTCADNWSCCVAPADCTSGKTTCRPGGNECTSCTKNSKTLNLLNHITGTQVVAGQHNDETQGSNWAYYTNLVKETTGKYPGLWSGDFVYSQSDHSPMVQEALQQWNSGAIINLMWHGCPPCPGSSLTCGWEGGVKSFLSNDEWTSLITDGSSWNVEWKKRMDYIGDFLKTLKSQGVEVMFRPLHEMKQGAFWWGGRTGASGTPRLYKITRDYMEKTLGLTNLLWVWNVQDLSTNYWE